MSNIHATNALVREVSKKDYTSQEWKRVTENKALVIVDVNKKEVLKKKPTIGFHRHIKTFLIDPEATVELSSLEVPISDFETGQTVHLMVTCQISLAREGQNKLVQAICTQPNTEKGIRDHIEAWVKKFAKNEYNFLQRFQELKGRLKQAVVQQAEEVLGLDLALKLNPPGNTSLEDENLLQEVVTTFVKDYKEKITLTYDAIIRVVPPSNPHYTIAATNRDRKRARRTFIRETIEEYLLDLRLQAVIDGLDDGVTKDLEEKINAYLTQGHGRKIARLTLELKDIPQYKPEEFRPVIEYSDNYGNQIPIAFKINMKLKDLGLFENTRKRQNIESLEQWVYETLEELVKEHLFDVTYVDLVLAFSHKPPQRTGASIQIQASSKNYNQAIEEDFKSRAKAIGYEELFVLVEPQLREIAYAKDGFLIESENIECATRTPDITIKLQLVLDGRIYNLNRVRDKINAKVDIKQKILSRAQHIIASEVHQYAPNEAFLKFTELIETPALASLRQVLENEFAVQVNSMVIKLVASDLFTRFRNLSRGIQQAIVTINPKYKASQHEEFTYELRYKVKDVDPNHWHIFQNNAQGSTPEDIDNELVELEDIFAEVVKSQLEISPQNVNAALMHGVQAVINATGLVIQPLSFRSSESIASKAGKEAYLQETELRKDAQIVSKTNEMAQKIAQLDKLEQKLSLLMTEEDADEDEIDEIKARINMVKKELELPFDTQVPKEDLLPPSATFDFQKMLKDNTQTNKQIDNNPNQNPEQS